jgi:pantothenate kinase
MSRHDREPESIPWSDAPRRILDAAQRVATDGAASGAREVGAASRSPSRCAGSARGPVVIGVTGPVGAGKSTLAARLADCVVGTDHYFPDYDRVAPAQRDLPEHSDLARLAADLAALRRGEPAMIPVWSFVSHAREGERRVDPAPRIVCEGIHALHEIPRPHIDIAVFVDAPAAVRWARWEALERSGARQLGVEAARRFFHEFAEPIYQRHAAAYRAAAHFVVINDSSGL